MKDLPEPDFIDRDPQTITNELIALYEEKTGKTLYPGQVDRIWVDIIAYRETLLRIRIQESAKQNLVRYASGIMLDLLGELVDVTRLPAQYSTTVLSFTVEETQDTDLVIPAGTGVENNGSTVTFSTDTDAVLVAGQLSVDVSATCDMAGAIGNDWQPGQITNLVDELGENIDIGVANITATANGSDEEDDENLRERIMLAPESFSTAGSANAYIFHAKSAHQDIVDVVPIRPEPGYVDLYLLTKDGLPDESLCDLVLQTCSEEDVRPLCDTVRVYPAKAVYYAIDAELVPYKESGEIQNAFEQAENNLSTYVKYVSSKLGRDVGIDQLRKQLLVSGIKKIVFSAPSGDIEVARNECAFCTGITLKLGEAEDE